MTPRGFMVGDEAMTAIQAVPRCHDRMEAAQHNRDSHVSRAALAPIRHAHNIFAIARLAFNRS
jgi:hypothetical protein